ncbi:MFS transporter [Paenibacillus sp. FSL K6-0276]|uniref:MFS transporter n=1 Tax=Paenibacillus sp. FSL K6-0276 TaxID=2921450 RepID=UPI0030EF757F
MTGNSVEEEKKTFWTRNFVLVCLSNLLIFAAFQMLLPIMPFYMKANGENPSHTGYVIGIATLAAVLVRPFIGKGLDTLGRRPLFLVGIILFSIAAVSFYFAKSAIWIYMSSIWLGLGWGATTVSLATIASDFVPKQRQGEGMGYFVLSSLLALAFAPGLGLRLAAGTDCIALVFLVSLMFLLLTLALSSAIKLTKKDTSKQASPRFWPTNKSILLPPVAMMTYAFGYGSILSFLSLYGENQHIEHIGWFYVVCYAMAALTRPFAGTWYDKSGYRQVLASGLALSMIGLFLLSYTRSDIMLIAAAISFGLGFGLVQPSLLTLTIEKADHSFRGMANSYFFMGMDLGISISSMVLGGLVDAIGFPWIYRFVSFLMIPLILGVTGIVRFGSANKSYDAD